MGQAIKEKDSYTVKDLSNTKVNDNQKLQKILSDVEGQIISLVPEQMTFGARPEFVLSFSLVKVNTTFGKYQWKGSWYEETTNGDIFLVDKKSKKYALHLRKKKEIAQKAGVIITDSREIGEPEFDELGRVVRARHQVRWEKIDINGSIKSGIVTGDYSLAAQIDKFTDKEGNVKQDVIKKQQGDALKLAESNAIGRAISDALPQMPNTFTLDELKKPFLVPCVIKDLSRLLEKYPDLEEALLAKELNLADYLYGNNRKQLSKPEDEESKQPAQKNETIPDAEDAKFQDIPPQKPSPEPTPEEKIAILAKEYEDQPEEIRVKKIEELLKRKGRTWKRKKAIKDHSAEQHVQFIKDLMLLPDKKQ